MQKIISTSRNWYADKPAALRLFLLVVVLPTLIAAFYYAFIASDIYIAESRYAVRTSDQSSASMGFLDTVMSGGLSDSPNEDATIVRDYIHSRDMMAILDEQLGIREHYQSDDIDALSRLDPEASREDFLEYYQEKIDIQIDTATNITTLEVRAFNPETARRMSEIIIGESEKLVNRLSDRIVEDTLSFARNEVDKAEDRVRQASNALTKFRSETQSINPDEETSAVLGIITGLETKLAEARAELSEAKGFMQPDSTQVKILEGRVRALQQQIQQERRRLASEGSARDYTRLIDEYQPLMIEQDLAKQRYESALTSLEIARSEAQRKQRYLLPFVAPQNPDEAMEPDRSKAVLIVFLVLCLIYGIGGLVWAAIKDHMRL